VSIQHQIFLVFKLTILGAAKTLHLFSRYPRIFQLFSPLNKYVWAYNSGGAAQTKHPGLLLSIKKVVLWLKRGQCASCFRVHPKLNCLGQYYQGVC
jgi:hypothetical protein